MALLNGEGGGGGSADIEVANYAALPAPGTAPGQTYIVLADQGTKYIGVLWGGNFYPKGFYYDATSSYIYSEYPFQATQAEVNTGTNTTEFVTPSTLKNSTQWDTVNKGSFGIQILKGTNTIAAGVQEVTITVPYSGNITGWEMYECSSTPVSSSIVIDTWSDAYGNYPPTVLDTIWGGSKPTLTTATKAQATGLSIPVTAGNTFIFNVDSVTSARNIVLIIYVTKS